MNAAIERFAEAVRTAASGGKSLRLRGGGTKDFYGQSLQGDILDTRAHGGIVDYEPTELVLTARCGTPLAEIESALAEKKQMLAFEPPHFAAGTTIGGVVAAGLSGPRRQSAGAARDFVLGAKILDGRGEELAFGGQVMKNVAGYDVSRLMVGSLGTLGLILEISVKTLPAPAVEVTLRLEMPEDKAIDTLNRWAGRPLPISASAYLGGELSVRLSGARAAVRAAREKLGGALAGHDEAGRFWTGMRDHGNAFFRTDMALWRLSVPSATPPLGLPGEQLIEWGGSLRWLKSNAEARTVRDAVQRAGGHATLFRGGDKSQGVFRPLAPALRSIHRRLKAEFDPHGVFNRGRMYADF